MRACLRVCVCGFLNNRGVAHLVCAAAGRGGLERCVPGRTYNKGADEDDRQREIEREIERGDIANKRRTHEPNPLYFCVCACPPFDLICQVQGGIAHRRCGRPTKQRERLSLSFFLSFILSFFLSFSRGFFSCLPLFFFLFFSLFHLSFIPFTSFTSSLLLIQLNLLFIFHSGAHICEQAFKNHS